jgi:hypothetical protein
MRNRKLGQAVLTLGLLAVLPACHTVNKTVGSTVSGVTNTVASTPKVVTVAVTGTVDRFRTSDVETGPIWSQEDAEDKCPKVAEAHQGKWNGQWRMIRSGQRAECGVIGGFTN